MTITRRQFLGGATLTAIGAFAPDLLLVPRPARAAAAGGRILVILQQSGGNDGVNTVVPFTDLAYAATRPTLAIPESQLLPISGGLGLHPSLANLKTLFDEGKLAIIPGVGYPNSNLSHFTSMDIWHTASPEGVQTRGWLGRYLDLHPPGSENALFSVNIGSQVPKAFNADTVSSPSIASVSAYQFRTDPRYPVDRASQVNAFLNLEHLSLSDPFPRSNIAGVSVNAYTTSEAVKAAASSYTPSVMYPNTSLAQGLLLIAQIIAGNLGTQIFYISTGGYDTHTNQVNTHANLLTTLSAALFAFQRDMEAKGLADRIVILTFSEFGRRVAENGSRGTDHGTSTIQFALGTPVKSGLYGAYPSLSELDGNGNLLFTTDFRSSYATVLENWLGADAGAILGGTFPNLGFLT